MKKEYTEIPETMADRKLHGFSWKDYVTAIPSLLYIVTLYTADHKIEACLKKDVAFCGEKNGFYAILSNVNKSGKLYGILKEKKECVLNFPSVDIYKKYLKWKDAEDESLEGQLTFESARKVSAPRIQECFLNLECKYLWEHVVKEGESHVVICLEIVHICIDEEHLEETEKGRYGETGYLYHIQSPINPEKFEGKSEDWMGILIKHRKIRDTSFERKENQQNSGEIFGYICLMIFAIFVLFMLLNTK